MKSCLRYSYVASPIGALLATAEGPMLTGLYLPSHKGGPRPAADWQCVDSRCGDAPFDALREQLACYFSGTLQQFDLPLRMAGTPFQQRVWKELARIPFGTTISYAQLAARIGQPAAARAVGSANGRNPISIVIPCHRVLGTGGSLAGYAGGLEAKRWLIDWEQRVLAGEISRERDVLVTV